MVQTTRHAGQWTLEDQIASPWHYLPVDVPPGTHAVRVTLDYERSAGVLDLGCLGAAGFRGWSGGARDSFVIATGEATPGYLPGEPEPGRWQVIIGLYRVPPDGLPYEVTAEIVSAPRPTAGSAPAAPPVPQRPPRRNLPASDGQQWRAGDLHTHTVHSDGALTVDELARFAVESGLDFIAVTDHNTVSHHRELPGAGRRYGITLIPGQEVTTSEGHAGALGDIGWVDFREPGAWLRATRERGGLLSVNHPIAGPAELDARHARTAPAGGGVALELARPELDNAAVLVAGLGPGRHPGRWQRLAPDRIGCAARHAHHLGGVRRRRRGRDSRQHRRLAGWRSRRTGTARCCCVPGASSSPWTRTAARWPGRTGHGPGCAATRRGSRPRPGCHRLLSGTGATLALTP